MNECAKNPLLFPTPHPRFDLIRAEHVEPALREILSTAGAALDELEKQVLPSWAGLVLPLRELSRPLDYAWGLVHHYMGVMNSEAWRETEKALQPEVVAFSLRMGQSKAVFSALEAMRSSQEWSGLSAVRQRVVSSSLRRMRLSGVGLPGKEREEYNDIQRRLAELGTQYQNNVLDATKAFGLTLSQPCEVIGLPPSALGAAAQAARSAGHENATPGDGPWRITLDAPSLVPFLKYSQRPDLREKLYRAYVTRASTGELDNSPIISEILQKRQRTAELLGFTNYAELSIEKKMAGSVGAVDQLLAKLCQTSRPHAEADLADLQELARDEDGDTSELKHWDVAFWAERLREKRFCFNDEDLRPYLRLPNVLAGLFSLARNLFDVDIVPADGEEPVWHEDVRFFRVRDAERKEIASFYLDPYSRPQTKRGGAWMDPAATREKQGDGRVELPVAYLVCNQTLPEGDKPSLMTFQEVTTLFHEFGHGLQHMLTTVDEPEASGLNNVEWDAVELASQFMENWCYHQPTLTAMTSHIETGDPLPGELFGRLAAARTFRAGSDMVRQLFLGMLDLELHARLSAPTVEAIFSVKERIAAKTTVMPPLAEDRMLCGFAHIFAGGYAAGYYSYKWAEVLSADAFAAFEEVGLDNASAVVEVGHRYRDTILAMGGGSHPMDVFRAFRGRDPDPSALLRHSGLL